MGWYLAEGHTDKNRLTITQSLIKNPQNCIEITNILKKLGWPFVYYRKKHFVIHSNVYASVMKTLCGTGAREKKIPITLLNEERTHLLLDSYFKGDGNYIPSGRRRYSTISPQLSNDLITLLSAVNRYTSLHDDGNIFRVIETQGRKYKRKTKGLVSFNGTSPVRIKSVEDKTNKIPLFDLGTENGWFVATNGIVSHNSYGVFGSEAFALYCPPMAESTTALGRYAILETVKKAKSLGLEVLYGDTDSVFVLHPPVDKIQELTAWSKAELSIDLELEKNYRWVGLSERKKNYLGVFMVGSVDIKGLMGKKRNTPPFVRSAFKEMIQILTQVVNEKDFQGAKSQIQEIVRQCYVRLDHHEYGLEELAFRVQLSKRLKDYTKTTPQHVRAARLLQARGQKVPSGSLISFVKTLSAPRVKPVELAVVKEIDIPKYKEFIQSTFEQVFDALGMDFNIVTGTMTLDAFT